MADNSSDSGFQLPEPNDPAPSAAATQVGAVADKLLGSSTVVDTTSRDLAIGGGILLVLLVAFFFAKNSYANSLVARKVPPRSANAAAWWLFALLGSLATAGVLGFVNASRFLTVIYMAPLGLTGLVSLVLMLVSARR